MYVFNNNFNNQFQVFSLQRGRKIAGHFMTQFTDWFSKHSLVLVSN